MNNSVLLNTSAELGFPGGTNGKDPPANAGDVERLGFDPCMGKFPWRRKWQPISVFLPGKSHGQRACRATVHGATKSQTRLKRFSRHMELCNHQESPC